MLLYKKEIEEKINKQAKLLNNPGVKIVLDEDPTMKENLSMDNYAYEGDIGVFVSDKDPFIVETKSGKRIVLDSDPVSYVSEECKNVDIDKVPMFKKRKDKRRLVLDQDPLSVKTKTGKKIILEPMNAYERKILHTALQNSKKVTTYSIGEEPRRKLVVDKK